MRKKREQLGYRICAVEKRRNKHAGSISINREARTQPTRSSSAVDSDALAGKELNTLLDDVAVHRIAEFSFVYMQMRQGWGAVLRYKEKEPM